MSWSYSGNPQNSKLDECRFLISDTFQTEPIMQDEEILFLIQQAASNENLLRYELFRQASTVLARDTIKRSLGPQSEDATERLRHYKQQTEVYKARISAAGISLPVYNYPKVFHKGMQSNPPWPQGGTQHV